MSSKTIDFDVLKRFNSQGPRYTSYPTAPLFSSEFTAGDLRQEIIETNKVTDRPLSLYFHFPFCAKLCYFCGCNMRVTHDRKLISQYNEYLKKEIDLIAPLVSRDRKVVQMHWGGGTPSYLLPEEILEVGNYIKERFDFADDIEASVEIDPRNMVREHIEAFAGAGFNRTSFGVQDFNLRVQQAINRVQSEEITRQVVEWAREFGFRSINLDLIYGLPYQTIETFSETVDKVIDISPDRVAVFNYAHVPWLKKHQAVMPTEAMPSPDQRLAILKMTSEKLTAGGYEYIGMDHFAKPTDELAIAKNEGTLYRNFQGYSTKAGTDLYAFGTSAISQFENVYAQNQKDIKAYYAAVDSGKLATNVGYRMTRDDHIRKDVIMQLMCDLEIDKGEVEKKFGIEFDEYFKQDIPKLERFANEGLVTVDDNKIRVIDSGILVIRNIAMCFDAYLEEMMRTRPVFSKTV
jgi:oxygen-independent coproporphyrinogen-3 oxidase